MNQFSKITSTGQTTIPAEIRAELGVGPGDRLEFVTEVDGKVIIRKAKHGLDSLRGIIKLDRPVDWDEVDRLIAERRGRG